ncbi:MAG: arginase family protein [Acidimicrobiales bacterium]
MSADWPSAAEWLATPWEGATLAVAGVPLAEGAVTPSRYDLTPGAVRARLERFSTLHGERGVALPPVRDLGDSLDPPPLDAALTVLVGGHNGVTFEALRRRDDLERWALLTLDAHHDVRPYEPGRPGNGSPVRALLDAGLLGEHVVQVGIAQFANSPVHRRWCDDHGITVHGPADVHLVPQLLDRLAAMAAHVYVDLDVDVLDRASAPGAPGSRPGGLAARDLLEVAFVAGAHPAVRCIDVVEVDAAADVASITVDVAVLCLLNAAAGFGTRDTASLA